MKLNQIQQLVSIEKQSSTETLSGFIIQALPDRQVAESLFFSKFLDTFDSLTFVTDVQDTACVFNKLGNVIFLKFRHPVLSSK